MGSIRGVRRGSYKTRTNISDKNYCWKCNKCFKRKAILAVHIMTKHLNYCAICPIYNKNFATVSACNRHLKNVHHISSYSKFKIKLQKISINSKNVTVSSGAEMREDFPNMSNAVELNENSDFGWHLIAKCDIDTGKEVVTSSAFASVELLKCGPTGCFECGKLKTKKIIQCPHCTNVWFCGKQCSKSKIHQLKCNRLLFRIISSNCNEQRQDSLFGRRCGFKTIPFN